VRPRADRQTVRSVGKARKSSFAFFGWLLLIESGGDDLISMMLRYPSPIIRLGDPHVPPKIKTGNGTAVNRVKDYGKRGSEHLVNCEGFQQVSPNQGNNPDHPHF